MPIVCFCGFVLKNIRDITRLVLERAGYTVTVYPNGEPLLETEYELPDLYLLDKQLSGIDGLEVCRYLKQQEKTKHIPVIMLSASPHISTLYIEAGANDFLEKPFSTKQLRDMTAKYMEKVK
jgi:CheY-like chemotaxis protein